MRLELRDSTKDGEDNLFTCHLDEIAGSFIK